tara:strand:+ start:237 stop:410 length:174 start_codon:yes stop_codon:yes gene_type:complete
MDDSKRIDKLKETLLGLINMLDRSCTCDISGDDHKHDLFDSVDKSTLDKIRDEVENI